MALATLVKDHLTEVSFATDESRAAAAQEVERLSAELRGWNTKKDRLLMVERDCRNQIQSHIDRLNQEISLKRKVAEAKEMGWMMQTIHKVCSSQVKVPKRIDLSFLSWTKRQGLRKVPRFAIFNCASSSQFGVRANAEGLLSYSFLPKNKLLFEGYLPDSVKRHYTDCFSYPMNIPFLDRYINYNFWFSGVVPDNTRALIEEFTKNNFSCFLIMEVPRWEMSSETVFVPMADPLVVVTADKEQFFLVDEFDLSPVESYVAAEMTTPCS